MSCIGVLRQMNERMGSCVYREQLQAAVIWEEDMAAGTLHTVNSHPWTRGRFVISMGLVMAVLMSTIHIYFLSGLPPLPLIHLLPSPLCWFTSIPQIDSSGERKHPYSLYESGLLYLAQWCPAPSISLQCCNSVNSFEPNKTPLSVSTALPYPLIWWWASRQRVWQ